MNQLSMTHAFKLYINMFERIFITFALTVYIKVILELKKECVEYKARFSVFHTNILFRLTCVD